jgi:phage I-like protein
MTTASQVTGFAIHALNAADVSSGAANSRAATDAPALGQGVAVALNAKGAAPDWVMLAPKGPRIVGNDGRIFTIADPEKIVEAFAASGLDAPIDINHAQFLKAPTGGVSPARGWIKELAVREGAIWGRVEWNEAGASAIRGRDYRYISPVFALDKDDAVIGVLGAGLVNRPNFNMPALNAAREERPMFKDLMEKLGLAGTASENDAIAAVDALQVSLNAAKGATPSLALYVPRADYDLALNARKDAETALAADRKTARDAEVTALIDGAVTAGKITPATKTTYLALCATKDGVEEFKKFLAVQPSAFTASGLDGKKPPAGKDGAAVELNADERALLAKTNLTEAQFLASKALGPVRAMVAE